MNDKYSFSYANNTLITPILEMYLNVWDPEACQMPVDLFTEDLKKIFLSVFLHEEEKVRHYGWNECSLLR